jgi:hypothetical protein
MGDKFYYLFSLKEYNPTTMSEDEVKLLTIQRLQRNDTGAYLCRVLNEYGFTDLIHYLNVLPGKNFIFNRFLRIKFFLLL